MRLAIFALMAIFFYACATQSTQNTSNLLNSRYFTRDIQSNSVFGLGLYGFQNTLGVVCLETDSNEACENLLQNACDGKNGSGCFVLGQIYEYKNDFESKLEYAKYTRLACEYGDYAGCMTIALENERIFKELKHTLEYNMVRDEAESKAIYATAKEVAKSALWGYERLVPLLQKECDNAKKRVEIAKEAHKTLGTKLLGEYRVGHINFDTFAMRRDKLQKKIYYEEFFASGYCKYYMDTKDGSESFKKALRGFK